MARRRKATAQPLASDVKATLEKAAASVDLTPQQLIDLIVDSGATSLPPASLLTEKYTLEDLGTRLWATMQSSLRSERAQWFNKLVDIQKGALICALRNKGFSTEAIASDFQIDVANVMRTWNAYSAQLGAQVVGIRLETIAGQLQLSAERAQQMAIESGDHKAYWAIQRDLVKVLQSIGIVDRAIHRVEVTHTFGDDKKHELDKLIELGVKEQRRAQEIKVIVADIEKGDPVPVAASKDYDDASSEDFDEE